MVMLQLRCSPKEIKVLKANYNEQTDASFQNLNSNNKISFLDPFIEIEGIWHVVGTLNKSSLKEDLTHPIPSPKSNTIKCMIIGTMKS